MDNRLPISRPNRPNMENEPIIHMCANEPEDDWRTPIIEFLKKGVLPPNRGKAQKLKLHPSHYTLIGELLYKRSFTLPYLRCLSPTEADYIIREVHKGIYENHSSSRSLVHKLIRAGYYWPTMQANSTSHVRKCDNCQRFASIPKQPAKELSLIIGP